MGTSTLSSLAELKMHIRGEHQEMSTKIRMKHLFGHQSRTSPADTTESASWPPPPDPNPGPSIELSTLHTSEASISGLRHLIPDSDDITDGEPTSSGARNPISLADLFDFGNVYWVNLYNSYAQKYLAEELALCELLNQDAATDEGVEVDVDEMTGEILTG